MKRVNMEAVPAHVSEYPAHLHEGWSEDICIGIHFLWRNCHLSDQTSQFNPHILLGRVSDVAYLQE